MGVVLVTACVYLSTKAREKSSVTIQPEVYMSTVHVPPKMFQAKSMVKKGNFCPIVIYY